MNNHPITFIVPGPPVAKQRPRKGAHGNWYIPDTTKKYEEQVGWMAAEAVSEVMDGPVELDVLWCREHGYDEYLQITVTPVDGLFQSTRTKDVDNVLKSVMDGMNKIVYPDDRYVVRANIEVKE